MDLSEFQMRLFLSFDSRDQVVKDVEIAFADRGLLRNSGSFKVVFNAFQAFETATIVELKFRVVAESRGIVV